MTNYPDRSPCHDSPDDLYALWDDAVERSRARLAVALADGGLDQLADPLCTGWSPCQPAPPCLPT